MARESRSQHLEITSLSAIEHILAHRPERIQRLIVTNQNGRAGQLLGQAKARKISVDHGGGTSSGRGGAPVDPVKALLSPFEYTDFQEFVENLKDQPNALVLALD